MKNTPSHIECELKYLIRFPDTDALLQCKEKPASVFKITQTYLCGNTLVGSERVRKTETDSETVYSHTEKQRIDDFKCRETERNISPEEYDLLLRRADTSRRVINKTRYAIPWHGVVLEVDIYPFWQDRAILEIELDDETETVALPECISVIRDVTSDARYKNINLAVSVPYDNIAK